ncbi:MAG: TlpA family protein disulfide reductase [Acidobacteria bacterium]|nr:TlpA family protein disulfide reductase [Acidobacteriota bacterium]
MNILKSSALAAVAAVALTAEVPRPAPKILFSSPSSERLDTSKYKGKVVVLEFLLTTCEHCQKTARILDGLQKDLGPRGVQVLGIAANTGEPAVVEDFRTKYRISFPVGWGDRDSIHMYLQHSITKMMYFPQVVMIDRKGAIRAQFEGGHKIFEEARQASNLRAEIEMLLKEPAR